jgi:shikimate kinase
MGTGKTETAGLLARQLGRTFVDMDDLIVRQVGKPIAEIFKGQGEASFRKIEKEIVRQLSQKEDLVVACGGGTFVDSENIRALKESGTVVCLTSTPEVILERTRRFSSRPLLQCKDPLERIKELLAQRAPFYAQAHCSIDCDRLSVEQAAHEVRTCLNLKKAL